MSKLAYMKFKNGEKLTRKQAIGAQCYECNGYSVLLAHDCLAKHCPLYQWSPWGKSHVLRIKSTQKGGFLKKSKTVLNPQIPPA